MRLLAFGCSNLFIENPLLSAAKAPIARGLAAGLVALMSVACGSDATSVDALPLGPGASGGQPPAMPTTVTPPEGGGGAVPDTNPMPEPEVPGGGGSPSGGSPSGGAPPAGGAPGGMASGGTDSGGAANGGMASGGEQSAGGTGGAMGGTGGMEPSAPGRVMLFNEMDLDNWTVSTANGDKRGNTAEDKFFQVAQHDGGPVIHVYKDTPANTSHSGWATLVTKEQYKNYHMHLEYKWGETMFKPYDNPSKRRRDSGFLYHILDPLRIHRTGFPHSLECQMMEGRLACNNGCYKALTGDFFGLGPTARSFVKGNHFLPQSEGGVEGGARKALQGALDKLKEWNKLEVIVKGSERGDYILNGVLVNQAFKASVDHGHIGIQAESAELYFRNFWLDPIDENTPVE